MVLLNSKPGIKFSCEFTAPQQQKLKFANQTNLQVSFFVPDGFMKIQATWYES